MPHISKKELPVVVKKTMTKQLIELVSRRKDGDRLLVDLLTETEQVMLAKRLAAIVLLIEGASLYRVQKVLMVSPSTAARFHRELNQGMYYSFERAFQKKEAREHFWKMLEKVSRGGLPEMGKGRWRWLNGLYEEPVTRR